MAETISQKVKVANLENLLRNAKILREKAMKRVQVLDKEINSMSDYAERSDFAYSHYRTLLEERKKLKEDYNF
jgi:hypothetical protein